MAKITAPNQQYNGLSATVMFVNGVGETDDPHLLEWFESRGYTVEHSESEEEQTPKPKPEPPVDDLPEETEVPEPEPKPAKKGK